MTPALAKWFAIPQINDSWTHPKYGKIKYRRDLGVYTVGNKRLFTFVEAIQYITKRG